MGRPCSSCRLAGSTSHAPSSRRNPLRTRRLREIPEPSPSNGRVIRLRRPPVVNLVDAPFVPEDVALGEVDAAWDRLRSQNPRMYDGALLHVLGTSRNGHGGLSIHVAESSYRFHAVAALGLDTGVRPLGAKAIVVRGNAVLMGKRSQQSGSYPGCWEYVPGGTVLPLGNQGAIDPSHTVEQELCEEVGLDVKIDNAPALAVFFDDDARTWEVVYGLRLAEDQFQGPMAPGGWEHEELCWVQPGCCESPVSSASRIMDSLARSFISAGV